MSKKKKPLPMRRLEELSHDELAQVMQLLASSFERFVKVLGIERMGFAILMWNHPRVVQYVSNCKRSEIVPALRELADKLERREDVERYCPPALQELEEPTP